MQTKTPEDKTINVIDPDATGNLAGETMGMCPTMTLNRASSMEVEGGSIGFCQQILLNSANRPSHPRSLLSFVVTWSATLEAKVKAEEEDRR